MRQSVVAGALLLALALGGVWGFGGATPSGSFPEEAASAPGSPTAGQQWIRQSDWQLFTYSDSLAEWLGEMQMLEFGGGGANQSGPLKFGTASDGDTASATANGYFLNARLRLLSMTATNTENNPACSLFVYMTKQGSAHTRLAGSPAFLWDSTGTGNGQDTFVFAADDTIPSDRMVTAVILNAGAGPNLPSDVSVTIYVKERVAP